MKQKLMNRIIAGLVLIFPLNILAIDPETEKIMTFVSSLQECRSCHTAEQTKLFDSPTKTCDALCFTCHKQFQNIHHKVGAIIEEKLPVTLPLNKDKKIQCWTCHDLNQPRFDTTPWKAQSLFDRIFQRKSQYKTYYLVINNRNGELCKVCH